MVTSLPSGGQGPQMVVRMVQGGQSPPLNSIAQGRSLGLAPEPLMSSLEGEAAEEGGKAEGGLRSRRTTGARLRGRWCVPHTMQIGSQSPNGQISVWNSRLKEGLQLPCCAIQDHKLKSVADWNQETYKMWFGPWHEGPNGAFAWGRTLCEVGHSLGPRGWGEVHNGHGVGLYPPRAGHGPAP